MNISRTISTRVLIIVGLVVLVLTALSVRGGASGITFALEDDFNLTIGSTAFFNGASVPASTWTLRDLIPSADKFFNLDGILPGDSGSATISMRVESRQANAWLCLDFTNLVSDENGVNDPETGVDANGEESGELAEGLNLFAWHDDGDNVFEVGEPWIFGPDNAESALNNLTYAIADASTTLPVGTGDTRHVGISWCAGDMTVNTATGSIECVGTGLENDAQTDSMSVDIAIRAQLERGRENFVCSGDPLPDGRERATRPNFERPDRPEFTRPIRSTLIRFDRPDRPTR